MGTIRTIASSIGDVLGNVVGDLLGQRLEASFLDTDQSEEESTDDGEATAWLNDVEQRLPNVLPDLDRLARSVTNVLGELSDDNDDASPSTVGQRVGRVIGRRLGTTITRVLGGTSEEDAR